MAELNVKVMNMVDGEVTEVEFEGAKYKAVEGDAKKGDIALVLNAWGRQEKGEYYRVINEDHHMYDGDTFFVYLAGKHRDASCFREDVQLFRKELITENLVKVEDGDVKEGDFVKFFRDGFDIIGGRLYEITEIDEDGDFLFNDERNDVCFAFGSDKDYEFEVYREPKSEPKPVSRDAKVGDKIIITNRHEIERRYENGDIFTVKELMTAGDVRVTLNNGYSALVLRYEYEVLEDVPLKEEVKETLQEGDYVVALPSSDKKYAQTNTECMELGVVTKRSPFGGIKIQIVVGEGTRAGDGGYTVSEKHFRKATQEEVEEILSSQEFNVGDYVKVIDEKHGRLGEVVKIVSTNYSPIFPYDTRQLDGGRSDCFAARHLVKATEDEIYESRLKVVVEVGDIVRIKEYEHGFPVGRLVVVSSASEGVDSITVRSDDEWYYAKKTSVELVAKASDRKDV